MSLCLIIYIALLPLSIQGESLSTQLWAMEKRFMAYDVVTKLKERGHTELLMQLASYVNPTDKLKGKLHEVFEPSFDAKLCFSEEIIEQTLWYMHENPCRGKWNLTEDPAEYEHSSARCK